MRRTWILPLVLIVECLVLGAFAPHFWDLQNILDRSRHFVEIGIVASAMTFVILSAGIDLSVGSIMGLSGTVAGFAWHYGGMSLAAACLLAGLVGVAAGGFNGWVVSRFTIPPLLVTLAGLALYRGLAYGIAKEHTVTDFPAAFQGIGQAYAGVVPVQLFFLAAVFLFMAWLFHRSLFGRQVALLGENEIAARLVGVPIQRIQLILYTLSGGLSALAGLIYTARLNTAKPDACEGYELDVIACVVLGGTRITGGQGSMLGTFMGLMIVGLLRYGLELAGISSVWITFTIGSLLIATAILNEKLAA